MLATTTAATVNLAVIPEEGGKVKRRQSATALRASRVINEAEEALTRARRSSSFSIAAEEDIKKLDDDREEARMAASKVLENLEFLSGDTDEEEEEDEEAINLVPQKPEGEEARMAASKVLEDLQFLSEDDDDEEDDEIMPLGEVAKAVAKTARAESDKKKEEEPDESKDKEDTNVYSNEITWETQPLAMDPSAGKKSPKEVMSSWRKEMKITHDSIRARRQRSPVRSTNIVQIDRETPWDKHLKEEEEHVEEQEDVGSMVDEIAEGYEPRRYAIQRAKVAIETDEDEEGFDFCDWLERLITPKEKQTSEKMGFCRRFRSN